MDTKENDFKSGKTVFRGMLPTKKKKLEHTVIQKYFFLEIPINVKGGRVKRALWKYITGVALDKPAGNSFKVTTHKLPYHWALYCVATVSAEISDTICRVVGQATRQCDTQVAIHFASQRYLPVRLPKPRIA
jgi:hypothetical protein